MSAPFERMSPEGITALPTDALHRLVEVGASELMRRGASLPQLLDAPSAQWRSEQTGCDANRILTPVTFADERIEVFPNYGDAYADGQVISLPPKVYSGLFYLANRADELVTADELLAACWPPYLRRTRNSVSQLVRRVRVALGPEDLGHTTEGAIRSYQRGQQRSWIALSSLRAVRRMGFEAFLNR